MRRASACNLASRAAGFDDLGGAGRRARAAVEVQMMKAMANVETSGFI
jgi:hypothetical protein